MVGEIMGQAVRIGVENLPHAIKVIVICKFPQTNKLDDVGISTQ